MAFRRIFAVRASRNIRPAFVTSAQFRGAVRAVWCDPRHAFEPKPGQADVRVYLDGDALEKIQQICIEKKLTWRSWWDGNTRGPISSKWNVSGWPTIVLIDHNGVIRFRAHRIDDKLLQTLVEEAEAAAAKTQ